MAWGGGPGLHVPPYQMMGMPSAAKRAAHSLWKRQNYADSENSSGYQGSGGGKKG